LLYAQFEVREDEEQAVKLGQIIDLLLAAGYFRVRIKGLSSFDKVIIVFFKISYWAIQLTPFSTGQLMTLLTIIYSSIFHVTAVSKHVIVT